MASAIGAAIHWVWDDVATRLSNRYPLLVGVPLMLLPLFILAGIVYLISR